MGRASTTIVLETKSPNDNPEYRINCIQNSEIITENPSFKNGFNAKVVTEVFGKSKVFTDEAEAMEEAFKIEREVGFSQHGIKRFNFFHLRFPTAA